jgi:hypothetical protein
VEIPERVSGSVCLCRSSHNKVKHSSVQPHIDAHPAAAVGTSALGREGASKPGTKRLIRTTSFMCRSRRDIRDKIAELERSGDLPRLIEMAATEAVPETDPSETGV